MSTNIMLFSMAFVCLAFLAIVWCLLWMSERFLGPKFAILIGSAAAACVVFSALTTAIQCASEPVFRPPKPGSGGEGAMVSYCDAPFGILDYAYAYFFAPVTTLLLGLMVLRKYRRLQGEVG